MQQINVKKRVKVTHANRSEFVELLIDYNELKRVADGTVEDLGGHILRDDTEFIDAYIYQFFKELSDDEFKQLVEDLDL